MNIENQVKNESHNTMNELLKLKEKCNMQLEVIKTLQKEKDSLNRTINLKDKELEQLKGLNNIDSFNNFTKYSIVLSEIAKELYQDFIGYKNTTQNSRTYYRVLKNQFDQKIDKKLNEWEVEKFINFCLKTQFIKTNKNQEKYFFPTIVESQRCNLVYINKQLINLILEG